MDISRVICWINVMIVSLQDLDLVMYHYRYLVFLSSVDMAEIIEPANDRVLFGGMFELLYVPTNLQ